MVLCCLYKVSSAVNGEFLLQETEQPPSEEALAYAQFHDMPGIRRLFGGSPLEFQDHLDHVKGDTRSTLQELPAKVPTTQRISAQH
jgi:hypothetical protein